MKSEKNRINWNEAYLNIYSSSINKHATYQQSHRVHTLLDVQCSIQLKWESDAAAHPYSHTAEPNTDVTILTATEDDSWIGWDFVRQFPS